MSKVKLNKSDPFAKREAQKYDNPIASREYIMEVMAERGKPLTYEKLVDKLNLKTDEQLEALRRRLIAMVRDGQLMKNRRGAYALVNKMDLVPGTVHAHKDGFGFLIPDSGEKDLYLSAKQMRQVMHGDRVLARVFNEDRKGRLEGIIVEVLERNTQQVVGRYYREDGLGYVTPSNKNMPQDILVSDEKNQGAKNGQMVVVNLIHYPDKRRQAVGEVVDILGQHMDPGMEIDVATLAYNIPHIWPDSVLTETKQFTEQVTEKDIGQRKDLRDLPLITIDGEDARDFDDAVYCEPKKNGGWRLVVAIADVSHYVPIKSALDQEGYLRGNSVYFPERVIPMLPKVLSNGLCSLNPLVDRLCMICDMSIDQDGNIQRYRFYDAVMHSKARMTYTKVKQIIDGETTLREQYAKIVPHIEHLYQLYQILHHARQQRGALDFDTVETRIVFSDQRKIEKIVPVKRNQAHMLIEECMLAANVCAARFLKQHKIPGLFRVHPQPKSERLDELRLFLLTKGLRLNGGANPRPKDYQQLLAGLTDRPDAEAIQTVILRSLNQAEYSPDNQGHFGLAYKEYGHFTSPIRRYPDLLLHRAIRHCLNGGNATDFAYDVNTMHKLGEHCSMTERRADEATRDVVSWLKCEYMSHRVGENFKGKVTGVTAFGLFVQLDDVYVEGLVHVTSLHGDYYHFDQAKQMLIGERNGLRYRLGDELTITVLHVDLEQRKIDFELAK